ncbi:MAG: siderophore-interacting protein [Candidatus Dactylopiibacterium sp.]|nr:siderophore-interacting protein [Candidatus Dactylopiibacterium sp.]
MESTVNRSRIQRVRYELRRRDVEVSAVRPLGENFISITFRGEALADFESASFDDHIKFMFTTAEGEEVRRDYTPRRFDRARGELEIEFALHATGRAADWARQARVGQRAVIAGPRGSMIIPMDYAWHLLVGDSSALPAMRRRTEELPAGARVWIIAQADAAADRLPFAGAARADVHWVDSTTALLDAAQGFTLPEGEGFIWAAGESASMQRLRAHFVDVKHHPREALRVAAYWKPGAEGFHEHLD